MATELAVRQTGSKLPGQQIFTFQGRNSFLLKEKLLLPLWRRVTQHIVLHRTGLRWCLGWEVRTSMFLCSCSKVGLRHYLSFPSKNWEVYAGPLLQGVWGPGMEKSILFQQTHPHQVSANDLILRSIWCSSSSQAFAVSDITYRSVILCNS